MIQAGSLLLVMALAGGALAGGHVGGGRADYANGFSSRGEAENKAPCTQIRVKKLRPGTLGPDGQPLSAPITNWEQVSTHCSIQSTVPQIKVVVPDCQPGCGSGHRSIQEWWAHTHGSCSVTTTNVPNDTLTCPGKADGRVCEYIKESPGPGDPTAITTKPVHIDDGAAGTQDQSPSVEPPSQGCGPGDKPNNTSLPQSYGTLEVGQTIGCTPGSWTGDLPIVYAFRWLRNGVPATVFSAGGSNYTIQSGDAGQTLNCQVRAKNVESDHGVATSPPDQVPAAGGGTGGTSGGTTGGTGGTSGGTSGGGDAGGGGGDAQGGGIFTLGTFTLNPTNGTGVLVADVGGAGNLDVTGFAGQRRRAVAAARVALIKRVRRAVKAAGKVRVPLRPTAAGQKKLRKTGRLAVVVRVKFTPTGGKATTRTKRVTLRLRRG